MTVLKKIDAVLAKVLEIFCVAFMIGLFALMIMKVFFRFVPVLSLFPSISTGAFDEIIEWLFAWLIMTCSTLLCRSSEHFRVDLISLKLSGKRSGAIVDFVSYLVALVFYGLLFYYGLKLCGAAVQTTPLLRWPKAWFYACVPFNSILMCFYTCVKIISCAMNIAHPKAAESK